MIDQVMIHQATCDNPTCGRKFTLATPTEPPPGIVGTVKVSVPGFRVTKRDWFAHSFRCIGPAVKAIHDKAVAEMTAGATTPTPAPLVPPASLS